MKHVWMTPLKGFTSCKMKRIFYIGRLVLGTVHATSPFLPPSGPHTWTQLPTVLPASERLLRQSPDDLDGRRLTFCPVCWVGGQAVCTPKRQQVLNFTYQLCLLLGRTLGSHTLQLITNSPRRLLVTGLYQSSVFICPKPHLAVPKIHWLSVMHHTFEADAKHQLPQRSGSHPSNATLQPE